MSNESVRLTLAERRLEALLEYLVQLETRLRTVEEENNRLRGL